MTRPLTYLQIQEVVNQLTSLTNYLMTKYTGLVKRKVDFSHAHCVLLGDPTMAQLTRDLDDLMEFTTRKMNIVQDKIAKLIDAKNSCMEMLDELDNIPVNIGVATIVRRAREYYDPSQDTVEMCPSQGPSQDMPPLAPPRETQKH